MNFFIAVALTCLISLTQAQEWIQWDGSRGVPNNQMPRGREADYKPLYIIRGIHPASGEMIPGKYNGDWGQAYISYGGSEIKIQNFEFFLATNVKWTPAANGVVPPNAVPGAVGKSGEVVYLGRVRYEGSIIPGKVHPSHKALYVAYGGRELKFAEYEQLVYV